MNTLLTKYQDCISIIASKNEEIRVLEKENESLNEELDDLKRDINDLR